jgi:hypothetical protein
MEILLVILLVYIESWCVSYMFIVVAGTGEGTETDSQSYVGNKTTGKYKFVDGG